MKKTIFLSVLIFLIFSQNIYSQANAGPDQVICVDYTNMQANNPAPNSGLWTVISGSGTFTDPTLYNTLVTNIGQGTNVYQWEVTIDGETYFDYVSVTNNQVFSSAGLDDVTCDGTYVLQGNNPEGEFIAPDINAWGLWEKIPPSAPGVILNPSLFNTQVIDLDNGVNVFRWTVTNGFCTDWDEVTVTNDTPQTASAGPDTIVCQTYLNNLNANNPVAGNGFWRVIAGSATITDPTLYNSSVTNLDYYCRPWTPDWQTNTSAVNIFEWVINYNGCESTDQVSVLNGLPETIDAGSDQTVCSNVINLDALDEASCADEHWWEQIPDVGNYIDPLTGAVIPDNDLNMPFNVHVDNIQDGVTQFIWHKTNVLYGSVGNEIRCELTDTVEIISLGLIGDIQAGPEDATCDNYYYLNATPPDDVFGTPPPFYETSGQWTTIFGNGDFDTPTYYNTAVRNMAQTSNIYRWTVTNHTLNCMVSDDVYIHNAYPSVAVAGPDQVICEDYTFITANMPVRYTNAFWEVVIGGAGIVNPSQTNTMVHNITFGTNIFVWNVINKYTGGFGGYNVGNPLVCESRDSTVITFRGIVAEAGNDIYECGDFAQLYANQPYYNQTGLWTGPGIFESSGTNTSTLFNDIVYGIAPGKNTFTWTVSNESCSDSDDLVVWGLLPPAPYANVDQTICISDVNLNANDISNYWTVLNPLPPFDILQEAAASGYWTANVPSVTFDNATEFNTSAHNIPAGGPVPTVFTWHSVNHFTDYEAGLTRTCELTDDMNVFNNSVTSEAGSGWKVCGIQGIGAEFILGATPVTPPQSGLWSSIFAPGAIIVNPTLYNSQVTGMLNGDHIYRWTVSSVLNGVTCYAEDFVTVPVRIPTTAVVALPSTYEICEDYTTLQANIPNYSIGETGLWTEIPVPSGLIADPTSNVTLVTGIGLGTRQFRWTIDNDGCTSDDIITVNNNMILADADDRIGDDAILHGIAQNDSNICQDWYVLSANDPNIYNTGTEPYPTGVWSGFPGTVTFDDINLYNTTVRNLNNIGTKISNLIWTMTKGTCVETSTLDITNNSFTIDADVTTEPNVLETCNGNIQLAGEQFLPAGEDIWTVVSGGGSFQDLTLYNTLVSGVSKPFSVYQWNVTRFGCTASDQVIVYNNQVNSNAGFDDLTCFDYIEYPIIENSYWTYVSGCGSITENTTNNTWEVDLCQGENVLAFTVTQGNCFDTDEVVITNNEPDDFTIELDKEVCNINSTVSVNEFPAIGTGIWSIFAGGASTTITDPTNIFTEVTDLQPGSNIFQWTVENFGCTKSDVIVITNNMVISDAGTDQFVCEDFTSLAAADPNVNFPFQGIGTWSVLSGGSSVVDPAAYNSSVTSLNLGLNSFLWSVSLGSCTDNDVVDITRYIGTEAFATDQTNCDGTSVLDGNIPGPGEFGLWEIINGSGVLTEPTQFNSLITDIDLESTSVLRWSVSNENCSNYTEISVINNGFEIDAGPDDITNTSSYQLNAEDPYPGTGNWSVISGSGIFSDHTLFNTILSGYNEGDNTYRWTVIRNACIDNDDVTITYDPVNIAGQEKLVLSVYPNPTDGLITISSSTDLSDVSFELTSISGKKVQYKLIKKTNRAYVFDMSNLAKGMYLMKIIFNGQTKLLRLVKK